MNMMTRILAGAAVVAGLTGAALAQTPPAAAPMPGMPQPSAPGASDAASTKDFKEADTRMMTNMHVAYTGDPDVDFRTHMIPHHQGAIDMAKVALKHAKAPDTKKMAEAIIKDQEREIGEMQAWLKKHGH